MMNIVRYTALIIMLFAFAACTDSSTKSTQESIQGKWELYSAQRNDKNVETLEGTYFHFMGDTLESNFPTTPSTPYTVPIEITANSITNLAQEVVFMVEPNDYTDTLHLSTMFKNNDFDLMLRRVGSD